MGQFLWRNHADQEKIMSCMMPHFLRILYSTRKFLLKLKKAFASLIHMLLSMMQQEFLNAFM